MAYGASNADLPIALQRTIARIEPRFGLVYSRQRCERSLCIRLCLRFYFWLCSLIPRLQPEDASRLAVNCVRELAEAVDVKVGILHIAASIRLRCRLLAGTGRARGMRARPGMASGGAAATIVVKVERCAAWGGRGIHGGGCGSGDATQLSSQCRIFSFCSLAVEGGSSVGVTVCDDGFDGDGEAPATSARWVRRHFVTEVLWGKKCQSWSSDRRRFISECL